jgi:phytoene synthase
MAVMIPAMDLAGSYTFCERLARREAGNFYHAFRMLPRPQRRAMCALYAFMRVADDLADDPPAGASGRDLLTGYRRDFDRALAGDYRHPLFPACHDTVQTYRIPREYLDAVLDGVAKDLDPVVYAAFDDLYGYCYRVASAVGLACIHIWGFKGTEAKVLAEKAGIAFQLTNILRDLREDAARGRIYLPREDLERFGYDAAALHRGERNDQFRALMGFEVKRARQYYDAALPLVPLLERHGRAVFLVMLRTYRGLLDAIEARDYDVFSSRVRLGTWRKLRLVLGALPVRYGWTGGY